MKLNPKFKRTKRHKKDELTRETLLARSFLKAIKNGGARRPNGIIKTGHICRSDALRMSYSPEQELIEDAWAEVFVWAADQDRAEDQALHAAILIQKEALEALHESVAQEAFRALAQDAEIVESMNPFPYLEGGVVEVNDESEAAFLMTGMHQI